MAFNAAHLFDKPDYSDVTISYSGRQTYCHKIIICQSSEYFKKLCGPGSNFAESNQNTIELKEDDPDAIWILLRYIYTKDHDCGSHESDWAFQLEIAKVAQKYLYPELHGLARDKAHNLLGALADLKNVSHAITRVRNLSGADEETLAVTASLQDRHLLQLMNQPEFRVLVEEDKSMMWKIIQQLAETKAEFEGRLCRMRLMWCEICGDGKLYSLDESDASVTSHYCDFNGQMHKVFNVECWLPKSCEDAAASFNEDTGAEDF